MIQINKKNLISGIEFHEKADIFIPYSQWIKRMIYYADLKEGFDYNHILLKSTGGRPKREYFFSIQATMKICLTSRKKKALEIYKFLSEKYGKEVILEQRSRQEYLFYDMLKTIFPFNFKSQVKILDYRIDFLFDNLIIEYDEFYHESLNQIVKDEKRAEKIKQELKNIRSLMSKEFSNSEITIIRVKQGFELQGIKEIFEYFIENRLISLDVNDKIHYSSDLIEDEKSLFLKEVLNNEVDLDYFKMTKSELIDKINQII